ncbi:MAG: hypothetical protein ACI8ZW_000960 [Yoonia sp.]
MDCGKLSKQVSFAETVEAQVSKAVSHTEYNFKSTYGYSSSYQSGDSKAGAVMFVYNASGDVVAQYATSNKLLDEYRGMENALSSRMKGSSRKNKNGARESAGNPQMTIDQDLL